MTPPPTIAAAVSELEDTFEVLGDWEQRYRYLIDLGRDLAPLSDAERSETNRVRGCASQVWLVRDPGAAGELNFRGDSDAYLVRGLIAVLLSLYSGRRPEEIAAFDAEAAFDRLGLKGALSQQRANGLAAMVARIRGEAGQAAG